MDFIDRQGIRITKPAQREVQEKHSAYGVYLKNGRLLLVKPHLTGLWEFPGGGKEASETLLEGLKREFLEETGYEVLEATEIPGTTIRSKFYANDIDVFFNYTGSFFLVTRAVQKQDVQDKTEVASVAWIALNEVTDFNAQHMPILQLIKKYNP